MSQTRSTTSAPAFFEMLLPIKVTGTSGQTAELVLNNTTNDQFFTLPLSFDASSVSFNYENQILTKNPTITNDTTFLTTSDYKEIPLKMYPNPTQSEIRFSGVTKKQNFEIYSLDGKLMLKGVYEPGTSINISKFKTGDYMIKINNSIYKIIKN